MSSVIDHLHTMKETIESLFNDQAELRSKQQKYDKLLSEKYHELEVKNFNAAEGYYLAKGLQAILQERRVVKHELGRIDSICKTLNIEHLKNSIHKCDKNVQALIDKNDTYTESFNKEAFSVIQ